MLDVVTLLVWGMLSEAVQFDYHRLSSPTTTSIPTFYLLPPWCYNDAVESTLRAIQSLSEGRDGWY